MQFKRTAIFVVSNKGGVGKTTLTEALYEYLLVLVKDDGSNVSVKAFDADAQVGKFSADYGIKDKSGAYDERHNSALPHGIPRFDARDRDDLGKILNAARLSHDFLLFDMPGGNIGCPALLYENDMASFVRTYERAGFNILVLNVIDEYAACARAIEPFIETWNHSNVRLAAVKSGGLLTPKKGKEGFLFFDGQEADEYDHPAQKLLNAGGKIIRMPHFDRTIHAKIDKESLKFSDAAVEFPEGDKQPTLDLEFSGPFNSWLQYMFKQFDFLQLGK